MNLRLKTLITLIILGCVGCMVFLMGTSFRRKGGVAETTIREGVNHAATIVISNNNRITKDLTIPIPSEEVELVEISSIEKGISRQKAFQMQSSQCSATMSAARSSSSLFAPTTFLTHKEEWSNFSPSVTEIQNETDMREWFSKNMDFWKRLTNMNYGEELDSRKVELNSLGLTLNAHLEPDRDHLPIWIRVFRRIDPLNHVLDAICKVDDIHKTILYVTVDGDKFGSIFELLLQVHCVKIKIFFHPFFYNRKSLKLAHISSNSLVLNMHYSYGMYLLISLFKYPYVITLEDDLQPSPDFYLYHKTLYRDVYVNNIFNNKESIFSIGAYTHGPIVDCKFLMARLLNEGTICSLKHMNQLVTELYFPGWGSGIESSIFWEYWSIWKNHPHIIYDGLLAILKRNRFTLIPCSPRIRLLRNMGTNGPANHRWDFYLSLFGRWTNATVERHYEIINSKIQ